MDTKKLAGNRPLPILGDFNVPHTLWGYKFQSKRGKALVKTMEDLDISLLNEPGVTTRRGNSVSRDTTPDLSWLSGMLDISWKCSLTKRWKRQRHNRKLARRIAELNDEISEYVAKLSKENWLQVCDGLQGQLSVGKTWQLLRHLIDPPQAANNRLLTKVLNTYDGDRLMKALEDHYFQTERGQHPILREYTGPSNEDLDRPFTIPEMWTAIDKSNKKRALGRDAITYRLLTNMSV
ncbi:hypothetical protein HPB49_013802 [Dermacentor silvarum]|uniref:Uncharacterized protein n=1 Tax=Dermacentor silvarum TaxID=543639 RepID=A0ACB8E0S4_DERSI|nr:hypothetical protein HPB49_013802 [Dermacentor silvarum]